MAAGSKSHWRTVCGLPVINGGCNLSWTVLTGGSFSDSVFEKKKKKKTTAVGGALVTLEPCAAGGLHSAQLAELYCHLQMGK